MKLFKSFVAWALAANTEKEWATLCSAIDDAFQHDKIKADENELLYSIIRRLHTV